MPAGQYADWAHAQPQGDDLAHEGEALFRALGCSGCHAASSRVRAPDLRGLFGRTVHLADGRSVTADEAYLRDSILQPRRDVVAGYEPIMPSYAGQVGDDEMIRLSAYIRGLKAEEPR
jgi:cytochrome c oxidase subunit 2